MKNKCLLTFLVILIAGYAPFVSISYASKEPLPSLTLVAPENKEYLDYLGISKEAGEEFNVAEIQTDILLIELFSMYCPFCQEEAPLVNRLYEMAEEQGSNGVRIKMIGLGASNTQFEVDYFKDNFSVPFPLFPDKTLEMYKKLKGEGTPGFIGVLFKKGQQPQIVLRQSGGFHDPGEFLALLMKEAGYN